MAGDHRPQRPVELPAVRRRLRPDWVAGVGTLVEAQANCAKSFSGGPVLLAQYSAGGLDADYPCPPGGFPPPVAAGLHVTSHALSAAQLTLAGTVATTYTGRVQTELDETYRGVTVRVRKAATVVNGRWTARIRLPTRYHGRVSTAIVRIASLAQDGVKAGQTQLLIHLHR